MSEAVGSLGDEATKLFAAAEQWWRDTHERDHTGETGETRTGPECAICPICQLLSALRGSRPDLFEHLSSAATSLMHAMRSTFESSGGSWSTPDGGPTVERIDIR